MTINKLIGKLRLLWFFTKSLFGVKIEGVDTIDKQGPAEIRFIQNKNDLKRFFEIYNVNAEDRIDYTNTHAHHHSNFKHLDNGVQDDVLEVVGLIYEDDGRTPKNPAEVFDMTYEEYNSYTEKILPISKERTIKYEDIANFIKTSRIVNEFEDSDRERREEEKIVLKKSVDFLKN